MCMLAFIVCTPAGRERGSKRMMREKERKGKRSVGMPKCCVNGRMDRQIASGQLLPFSFQF